MLATISGYSARICECFNVDSGADIVETCRNAALHFIGSLHPRHGADISIREHTSAASCRTQRQPESEPVEGNRPVGLIWGRAGPGFGNGFKLSAGWGRMAERRAGREDGEGHRIWCSCMNEVEGGEGCPSDTSSHIYEDRLS